MNGKTHRVVGAVVGAGSTVAYRYAEQKSLRLGEFIGGGLGGVLGASLPDILEPATSSWHRGPAHSATGSAGLLYVAFKTVGNVRRQLDETADRYYERARSSEDWLEKGFYYLLAFLLDMANGFVTGVVPGYVSHVALDATTPRSVPILGL